MSVATAALLGVPAGASAQGVACPNSNPIVHENNCMGAGTTAYRLDNYDDNIGGFSTKTSFALGENVPLKIARNAPTFPATRVDIRVYRLGYYGGMAARHIPAASANGVTVNNDFTCNPMDPVTGKLDCGNWNVTYTIPGSALPVTGNYVAKLRTTDTGIENWVHFVVRDDNRVPEAKVLMMVPTATYQAYNNWGGKSLYFDKLGGANTVTGTQRAAKVSFNRPLDKAESGRDRFFGPDQDIVYWLEQQGYDVAYTDEVQGHVDPLELRQHKVVVIGAHAEYWSGEEMAAFKAARDAGVGIANFGANTGYWKVRYEDGVRTLVCYKTVQGGGSGSSGALSENDWGPDGLKNTADDALGLDRVAGTADDNPQNSTTTFRDNGAPNGDPNAPPGGRVGPDNPENSLFGTMYVGDDDNVNYPFQVPATNANGEFSGDRIWRNTGLATNTTTSIGTIVTGWEWDAVPTQAQYLAHQPAGVRRLSDSSISGGSPSWLLDEGRQRADVAPPGQPNSVQAVKYRAASGAWVFSAGTNHWGYGLTSENRIAQATYNMLSDMAVQPSTPVGITLDPIGNLPPIAAFTMPSDSVKPNVPIQFDASASSDPDGSVANYAWDFDGNGTFEVNAGSNPVRSHTFTSEGMFDIRLRVTDNGGATDLTVRTLEVIENRPPTAAVTAAPNPAVITQTVVFNGSGSTDPDGTIARYQWDLDGNGSYETDTGATSTASTSYHATGTVTAGLRVTDSGGKTATASIPITVNAGGISNYGDAVLDTPGLIHYWRLGESAGPTFADSKGTSPAAASGGVTFGVPPAPPSDTDAAARFDGSNGTARATVGLADKQTITVEFWLKMSSYSNNDALALELTDNFNNVPGGFIVDPNAPQNGGTFAVGMGNGTARNNVFFARPTAGEWHHYAIVMDHTAPAAQQITPYVDGRPVTYTKNESGTGGGFANAALHFMSRGGTSLFNGGDLDDVAIYDRALSQATIDEHFQSYGTNRRPIARFTMTPNPVKVGTTVTFNGSTSSDPDGSITRYQWDLDGNGTYEVDSGSNPQVTRSYSSESVVDVRLRVTDTGFGADTETKALEVGNKAPVVSFTATPNPAVDGQTVRFDAGATQDVDGSIARLEWDLDGDGTFETDTGTTTTTSRVYDTLGTRTVGLRATDDEGKSGTGSLPVTINSGGVSSYGDSVLDTPGLVGYWRLGESSGTTLADSKGTSHATAFGPVLGVPGAVANDPNTSARFDGTDDYARASVDLSSASAITVEFWLKWNAYEGNDDLALELTDNFNNAPGGFIMDPNAPQNGGTFGVGMGSGTARNNVFFARPSAGQWHHYAVVMDRTAPAAQQITPYVDGQPVSYTKNSSGTGGGFANANLYFMSRGGTSLFGAGDIDEVAIYNRALSANTIGEHFGSQGANRRPNASFTASPNPAKTNQTITFDASASSDPDGTIDMYQWDLDGNGSFETGSGSNPVVTRSYSTEQELTVKLRVIDDAAGADTESKALSVGNNAPTAAFTVAPNPTTVGQVVSFDAAGSGDVDGTIAKYEWDLDGNGTYETDTGTTPTATRSYATGGSVATGLRVTDNDGKSATATRSLSVKSASYRDLVLGTTGLRNYWRMGETSGTQFADSAGAAPATIASATLGVAGALAGDADGAAQFDGTSNHARAALNLSNTSALTVEFWLKWDAFSNNDDLAMEFTSNFNQNAGGFLIDPNAGSSFGLGIGIGGSRNTSYFTRPSAGQWHHYAVVMDSAAPAANQITPYVDGVAVPFTKGNLGVGAGPFANSTLYFMSRNGTALFGGGVLDELALYGRTLDAATIAEHYQAGLP